MQTFFKIWYLILLTTLRHIIDVGMLATVKLNAWVWARVCRSEKNWYDHGKLFKIHEFSFRIKGKAGIHTVKRWESLRWVTWRSALGLMRGQRVVSLALAFLFSPPIFLFLLPVSAIRPRLPLFPLVPDPIYNKLIYLKNKTYWKKFM